MSTLLFTKHSHTLISKPLERTLAIKSAIVVNASSNITSAIKINLLIALLLCKADQLALFVSNVVVHSFNKLPRK